MQRILFMTSEDAQYEFHHLEHHAGGYDTESRHVVGGAEEVHAEADGSQGEEQCVEHHSGPGVVVASCPFAADAFHLLFEGETL